MACRLQKLFFTWKTLELLSAKLSVEAHNLWWMLWENNHCAIISLYLNIPSEATKYVCRQPWQRNVSKQSTQCKTEIKDQERHLPRCKDTVGIDIHSTATTLEFSLCWLFLFYSLFLVYTLFQWLFFPFLSGPTGLIMHTWFRPGPLHVFSFDSHVWCPTVTPNSHVHIPTDQFRAATVSWKQIDSVLPA